MTKAELSRIEKKLQIRLPDTYRALMTAEGDRLKNEEIFRGPFSQFFVDARLVIDTNIAERHASAGTEEAFPDWATTFFLIGTNGAGDFYCLRLDGKPGVWMIGSDCGCDPTQVEETLETFIFDRLEEYQEEQRIEAVRQATIRLEMQAELKALPKGSNPSARRWLESTSPYVMFRELDGVSPPVSPRKLRLFGIACCRRLPTLSEDPDCARAMNLAEGLAAGSAKPKEAAQLAGRLNRKRLAICDDRGTSPAGLWGVSAAMNLLQTDEDFRADQETAGAAELRRVWTAVNSVAAGTELTPQADLLREVLGNPFHPATLDVAWCTPGVVGLARTIHEEEAFGRMPELAAALEGAGCRDPRFLAHARRPVGHVRGCWLLDGILGLEPTTAGGEFSWDFECQHPTIPVAKLKTELERLGPIASGRSGAVDKARVLQFADWVEQQGDSGWAAYIRTRCELDRRVPPNMADLIEQRSEGAASMRPLKLEIDGFYFSGYRLTSNEWWEDGTDDMAMGLPSRVDAVTPGRGQGPVDIFLRQLEALIRRTPIRGVQFDEHFADEMSAILNSAGGRQLRSLSFDNNAAKNETSPVITALAHASVSRRLESLRIQNGIRSDRDARALAEVPFGRLRRLDLSAYSGLACSGGAAKALMSTDWFRALRHLLIGFDDKCCDEGVAELSRMPRLESLALWNSPQRLWKELRKSGQFPSLRRLFINQVPQSGHAREALSSLDAPRLIDLWLSFSKSSPADLAALARTLMGKSLRLLTIAWDGLESAGFEAVATSPSAARLRSLRLLCGGSDLSGSFRSLAGTPLAREGTFPSLTTLSLEYPFPAGARQNTAELLRTLATPHLRHLTLIACCIDDECADLLATSPTFANLRSLKLEQPRGEEHALTGRAASRLFASSNLQNLVELDFRNFSLGKHLERLLDRSMLPSLGSGSFWDSGVSERTEERFRTLRPEISPG